MKDGEPEARRFSSLRAAAPFAALAAAILLPLWEIAAMRGHFVTDDVFTSDMMNEGFAYRRFLGEALKAGEAPTWFPHIYGGFPLVARAEAGACYPPNLLLFGLLPPYVALNLVLLFTLLVAAAGSYLFAREIVRDEASGRASDTAPLVAGFAFAWSGFMVCHLRHFSMTGTVAWFPLALWLLTRALAASAVPRPGVRGLLGHPSARPLLGFAAVFGVQNLAGHAQTAYYCALVYAAWFVCGLAVRRGPERRSRLAPLLWFAAACVLGVAVGAVQLLPTAELVGLSQRAGGLDFSYASDHPYAPRNALTFVAPYANGDPSDGSYRLDSIFWEDYGYVGVTTLLLAILGAATAWRRWQVRFLVAAALAAYVLVLGRNTPVYEAAFRWIPGMQYFRFPQRLLFVVDAALAALGALGAARLAALVPPDRRRPALAWGLAAVVLGDLVLVQLRQNPVADADVWQTPPRTARLLAADGSLFRILSPGAAETHKAAYAAGPGWSRGLAPFVAQREFLQPDSNSIYGIASADGYAQLTPSHVVDVWGDQNRGGFVTRMAQIDGGVFVPEPAWLRLLALSNVKYILSPWPIAGRALEEMERVGDVFLYRNPAALPRAYLAGGFRIARDAAAAEAALRSAGFDPARETLVAEPPPISGAFGRGTVAVERYASTEVLLAVEADGDALLVLADTDYPGWRAEIDGRAAPILRANLTQRAVVVPAGRHSVRFAFESAPVRVGLAVSLSAAAVLAALVALTRPRRDRRTPAGGG